MRFVTDYNQLDELICTGMISNGNAWHYDWNLNDCMHNLIHTWAEQLRTIHLNTYDLTAMQSKQYLVAMILAHGCKAERRSRSNEKLQMCKKSMWQRKKFQNIDPNMKAWGKLNAYVRKISMKHHSILHCYLSLIYNQNALPSHRLTVYCEH